MEGIVKKKKAALDVQPVEKMPDHTCLGIYHTF